MRPASLLLPLCSLLSLCAGGDSGDEGSPAADNHTVDNHTTDNHTTDNHTTDHDSGSHDEGSHDEGSHNGSHSVSGSGSGSHGGFHGLFSLATASYSDPISTLAIVAAIVCFTVLYETVDHKVEHWALRHRYLDKAIGHIKNELLLMGLVSFLMELFQNLVPALQEKVNAAVYHYVHMQLFLFGTLWGLWAMWCFVDERMHVGYIKHHQRYTFSTWCVAESDKEQLVNRICCKPLANAILGRRSHWLTMVFAPIRACLGVSQVQCAMMVHTLRASVIIRNRTLLEDICAAGGSAGGFPPPKQVARHFNFARYLGKSCRRSITENLHVHPIAWLAILGINTWGWLEKYRQPEEERIYGVSQRIFIFTIVYLFLALLVYGLLMSDMSALTDSRRVRDGCQKAAIITTVEYGDAVPLPGYEEVPVGLCGIDDRMDSGDSLSIPLAQTGSKVLDGKSAGGTEAALRVMGVRDTGDAPPARGWLQIFRTGRGRRWLMVQVLCFSQIWDLSLKVLFCDIAWHDTHADAYFYTIVSIGGSLLTSLLVLPQVIHVAAFIQAVKSPADSTLHDTLQGSVAPEPPAEGGGAGAARGPRQPSAAPTAGTATDPDADGPLCAALRKAFADCRTELAPEVRRLLMGAAAEAARDGARQRAGLGCVTSTFRSQRICRGASHLNSPPTGSALVPNLDPTSVPPPPPLPLPRVPSHAAGPRWDADALPEVVEVVRVETGGSGKAGAGVATAPVQEGVVPDPPARGETPAALAEYIPLAAE